MDEIPLSALFATLAFLVLLSAFFSAAEIALVTLNRYKLHGLAESGHRGAQHAQKLLERPDRLIGVILLGSNSVNALFSALTTYVLLRYGITGENAIAIATLIITLVVLILTDLAPKTLATLHPDRIAFPSAWVLRPLLKLIYPVVWFVNLLANGLLRLIGVRVKPQTASKLTTEELHTLVLEAGVLMPEAHQDMLLAILELEKIQVDDIMVPRGEIDGVNLDADWDEITVKLGASRYTRLPAFRGSLDNVVGVIHLRKILHLLHAGDFTRERLQQLIVEPLYIPQGVALSSALLSFRGHRRRTALVVNEYGDIIGLVTLERILEEIVGDFTTADRPLTTEIQQQDDGSVLVPGNLTVRELNRLMDWDLPTTGPKTINGLVTEHLRDLPESGTSLLIENYLLDIVRTRGTSVQQARIQRRQPVSER